MTYDGTEAVAEALETFIRHHFQVPDDDAEFTRDVHLWEAGYVDSIGVAEVLAFIEETFEVTIPETTLFDPEFVHIGGMARVVHRLRAAACTPAAHGGGSVV